jgi:hypothetical protein
MLPIVDVLAKLPRALPEDIIAAIEAKTHRLPPLPEGTAPTTGTESGPHETVTVADLKRSAEIFAAITIPT